MPSLLKVIQELIEKGVLPEGTNLSTLTDEQWLIVQEMIKKEQEKAFKEGSTIGIKPGLTPKKQARQDRENPNLKDPLRDSRESGENKG